MASTADHLDGQLPPIHVERDTPAWKAAWGGLSAAIARAGLGDGRDRQQYNRDGEGWQILGARLTEAGMRHVFRHRDHPLTERREYIEVDTPKLEASLRLQQIPSRGLRM